MNSSYYHRHNGSDHVVLWSLGNYHPWPKHCKEFMTGICARCTFTCYWMDGWKAQNNFISIPFPSAFHWSENMTDIPWSLPPRRLHNDTSFSPLTPLLSSLTPSSVGSQPRFVRNNTVVYLGSTKTLNPDHTKIRRAMVVECQQHTNCSWKQIQHSSKDSSIGELLTTYRKTVFCLCPPGDDPARRALFGIFFIALSYYCLFIS